MSILEASCFDNHIRNEPMTRIFTHSFALVAATLISLTMLAETTRLPLADAPAPASIATPLIF